MEELEQIIKNETGGMFVDSFYKRLAEKINDFYYKKETNFGYVYFIKNGINSNLVKIGYATNLDNRVKSYSTAFENNIYVIGYIESENAIHLEKEIHSLLKRKREKGEWFNLEQTDFDILLKKYQIVKIFDFFNFENSILSMNESEMNELVFDYTKKTYIGKKNNNFLVFKKIYNENPNFNRTQVAKVLGVSRKTIQHYLKSL